MTQRRSDIISLPKSSLGSLGAVGTSAEPVENYSAESLLQVRGHTEGRTLERGQAEMFGSGLISLQTLNLPEEMSGNYSSLGGESPALRVTSHLLCSKIWTSERNTLPTYLLRDHSAGSLH